jgi:DNA mismatch endonuclease (patch repair protein)
MMSAIRGKHTQPERAVRSAAHGLGYRFRLHRRDLPGTPDLVFPRLRVAILVHGCFWHRHDGCRWSTMPSSNVAFWDGKFRRTIERDRTNEAALLAAGWEAIVIWECETRDPDALRNFLGQCLGRRT